MVEEMKHVRNIAIIATMGIVFFGVLSVYALIDNANLQKQLEKEQNRYIECVQNSIENKWLVEQYQHEINK